MNKYYVYMHINNINGKMYVGLTKQFPTDRWGVDGKNYKYKCPVFWNAIQKYGWDNFEHIIYANGLSKEDACKIEIQLIKAFKTQNRQFGYNILEGGSAPSIPDEVRKKMSNSMKGNKNGLGHICTDEKKKKISDAQKGRKLTDEHKKKLSIAKKGKSHSSPSDLTRKKISDSHEKLPVYCLETNSVYQSIQECARQLDLWPTLVCKCCKGKLKSTGGYHLSYYKQ